MMKFLISIFIAVAIVIGSLASGFANSDAKYYSEFVFKYKLNDKFDLFYNSELRFKNDMGSLYYKQFLRIGSVYHAYKNLDLALAYRYFHTKNIKGEWDENDTQYIEILFIPKIKLGNFDLSDANKIEYRFIEGAKDRWVYRNLITLAYPTKIGKFDFTPYISNELYYDTYIQEINLNWLTLGATKKISKYLTVGLYYRDETARVSTSSSWITAHILGTNITISF